VKHEFFHREEKVKEIDAYVTVKKKTGGEPLLYRAESRGEDEARGNRATKNRIIFKRKGIAGFCRSAESAPDTIEREKKERRKREDSICQTPADLRSTITLDETSGEKRGEREGRAFQKKGAPAGSHLPDEERGKKNARSIGRVEGVVEIAKVFNTLILPGRTKTLNQRGNGIRCTLREERRTLLVHERDRKGAESPILKGHIDAGRKSSLED